MDNYSGNKEYNIYRDIRNRTNGEIYLGIVGPVRTGKSTFIKRFMELMVLPFMEGEAEKQHGLWGETVYERQCELCTYKGRIHCYHRDECAEQRGLFKGKQNGQY